MGKQRHRSLDELMSSHNLFDDWLKKNPLPSRFLEPERVPQEDDKPSATNLLNAMRDDDGQDDEPEPLSYRVPRWWFLLYIAALVVLMVLAVRFWKELP